MLVPVSGIGDVGVNKDVSKYSLPPEAWTDARNVVFRDGKVSKCAGHSVLLTPAPVAPYALFPAPLGSQNFWIVAGLAKVHAFYGASTGDITRAAGDYTGTAYDYWNGGMFNGVPFLNNGVDNPQVWAPISLAQPLVDLPNWPANTKAKVVRAFKSFLIALDVSKSGVRNTRLVKWSHGAAPGTVPVSWDETDTTKDAGEFPLSESEDSLIDCLPLGDANMLYTETACWSQTLSGGFSIFNFNKRFDSVGLLTQNCVGRFKRRHFVVTQDDFVVHDGTQAESIADARLRKWVFSNLTSSVFGISFVLVNNNNKEIWFCFPYGGGGVVNMAAIWNWNYNTWTIRELPNVRAATSSLYNPQASVDTFDTAGTVTIADDTGEFGETSRAPSAETIIYSPPDTSGILQVDDSNQFSGQNFTSYVERIGLPLAGISRDGKPVLDHTIVKLGTSVWPQVEAAEGTVITISLGAEEKQNDGVTWADSKTFTVGTDRKVDLYATGVYFALRFSSTQPFDLLGYHLDVVPLGAL